MSNAMCFRYLSSPIGTLLLTSNGQGLNGLHMTGLAGDRAPVPEAAWKQDDTAFVSVVQQLEAYFAGEALSFDVSLVMDGTSFQRRVWQELCQIPYGRTISYIELARRVGHPRASRAVGGANGKNPIAVIVPCHRVIAAGGGLGGYGGGLDRKRWLLDHEAAVLARHPEWRPDAPAGAIRQRPLEVPCGTILSS